MTVELLWRLINTDSENFADQDSATLEIYAACYAEVGEFAKAVQFQQEAVKKTDVESTSQAKKTPQLERLELYRRGQAYHTPNTDLMPIQVSGSRLTNGGFRALRY